MKINIIRGILTILLLWTFCIIFGFSNQNAEKSSSISKKITQIISANIKDIRQTPESEKTKILSRMESIIRKIAHFSIYTVVRNFTYDVSFNI